MKDEVSKILTFEIKENSPFKKINNDSINIVELK